MQSGGVPVSNGGATEGCGNEAEIEVGAAIWVPCPTQVWQAAVVVAVGSGDLAGSCQVEIAGERGPKKTVQVSLRPKTAGGPETFLRMGQDQLNERDVLQTEDLSQLAMLHEAAVLHALQVRFFNGLVYTLTGPVLLAVNPFRELPELYSTEKLQLFAALKPDEPSPFPHVYGVGRAAYEGVHRKGASQTVLVSGESGAGKTETTKFVMRFLALAGAGCAQDAMSTIERRVLQAIPILEALGNAKTLRNDNSSRFGKYTELQFGRSVGSSPRLLGAKTHTYLLEKVRVLRPQEGERSFHIFYQVLAAAATPNCEIRLDGARGCQASDFNFLKCSSCHTLRGHDESQDFNETLQAFRAFSVPDEEIAEIFGVIITVLHLGNLSFRAPKGNSEGSEVTDRDEAGSPAAIVSSMLGIEAAALDAMLCRRSMKVKDEKAVYQSRTLAQAEEGRDALARHLYGIIFNHVVGKINSVLAVSQQEAGGGAGRKAKLPFVGVLDIFGFEFFQSNSFEQLCINFTNELLQQYFNEVIFEYEENLYVQERIEWNPQDFPDNKAIVVLLGGDGRDILSGVLPMLDEECNLTAGTPESWCRKMGTRYGAGSKLFQEVKRRPGNFTIQHFAGPVEYESKAFLAKNKDKLSADAQECLQASTNTFVRERFLETAREFGTKTSDTGRVTRQKAYSVSSDFRQQLKLLMESIRATVPHFVRCIKPNPQNLPNVLNRMSVTEQLRYQGVLQAIEVSRAGYPVRLRHREAIFAYKQLADKQLRRRLEVQILSRSSVPFAEAAAQLFVRLQETLPGLIPLPRTTLQVGVTQVFFKREAAEVVDSAIRRLRATCTLQMQSAWRRLLARRRYVAMRTATVRLQAAARALAARRLAKQLRRHRAAVTLQCLQRRRAARAKARTRRDAADALRSWARARVERGYFLKLRAHSVAIQRRTRRVLRRKIVNRRQRAAMKVQTSWRRVLGAREAAKMQRAKLQRDRAARKLLRRWRSKMLQRIRRTMNGNLEVPLDAPDDLPGRRGTMIAAAQCVRQMNTALGYEAAALERSCARLERETQQLRTTSLSRVYMPWFSCCVNRENQLDREAELLMPGEDWKRGNDEFHELEKAASI